MGYTGTRGRHKNRQRQNGEKKVSHIRRGKWIWDFFEFECIGEREESREGVEMRRGMK